MEVGTLPVRVAIHTRRRAMGRPSGVCDAGMRIEYLAQIGLGLLDELLQLGNLANFLVCKDFIFLVSINRDACRIIATVFETG